MFRNTASEPVVPKIMCHSNHLVCLTAIIKYDRCREYRRECCKQERHFVYLGSELAKSTRSAEMSIYHCWHGTADKCGGKIVI